ncbi:HEPN domain-containing protein [Streptomyces profundus]|uniref:ApeA N-terminal domain 1-containing protein n=1 Tax=Streptomyces profundus TaxID=2867410 RepID=UPI001D16DCBE|nr:HEPN domain-containing protein [Streptomyces sp. MA3_2.13]UED85202.1 hypothetical protein K4G22_14180 [Streptomyces sp. MA3_2.13]
MKPFEGQGHWWLLGDEERRLPGTLKINAAGDVELHIIGSLSPFDLLGDSVTKNGITETVFTEESAEKVGTYPRIHGIIGTTAYTLEDCFQKRADRNLLGGVPTEVVHVNQVFKGVFYEEGEEVVASGISFTLKYLSYWVLKGGLSSSFRFPERQLEARDGAPEPRFSVYGHEVQPESANLADSSELRLRQHLVLTGDGVTCQGIKQSYYYHYDPPSLSPMDTLLEVASDLQDLVSIATNRTAQFDEVNFYHPDVKFKLGEGRFALRPIEFHARWTAVDDAPVKISRIPLVFGYKEFGGMDGVAAWLDVARKHRTSLGRVMSTRYSKSMSVSDRLLNRAASLESFDRTLHGDSIDFGARMSRCANYAGGTFMEMVKDRRKWSQLVKGDRDDIAHNLGRNRETSEQVFLADSLYWLFVLCLLKESKASRDVFRAVKEYGDYSWLCRKMSGLLASS